MATGLGHYDPSIYIQEMLNMHAETWRRFILLRFFYRIVIELRYEQVLQSVRYVSQLFNAPCCKQNSGIVQRVLFSAAYIRTCYHGMGRPQVQAGRDGLRTRRVAGNILIRRCGRPTRGGAPRLETSTRNQKVIVFKDISKCVQSFRVGQLFRNYLNKRKNVRPGTLECEESV